MHLPQSLPGGAHTVAAESPVVSTHSFSSERRIFLSATTNSHSNFLSTPGRVVTTPGMSNLPSIVYVLGNSTTSKAVASACATPVSGTSNVDDVGTSGTGGDGDGTVGDVTGAGTLGNEAGNT